MSVTDGEAATHVFNPPSRTEISIELATPSPDQRELLCQRLYLTGHAPPTTTKTRSTIVEEMYRLDAPGGDPDAIARVDAEAALLEHYWARCDAAAPGELVGSPLERAQCNLKTEDMIQRSPKLRALSVQRYDAHRELGLLAVRAYVRAVRLDDSSAPLPLPRDALGELTADAVTQLRLELGEAAWRDLATHVVQA